MSATEPAGEEMVRVDEQERMDTTKSGRWKLWLKKGLDLMDQSDQSVEWNLKKIASWCSEET